MDISNKLKKYHIIKEELNEKEEKFYFASKELDVYIRPIIDKLRKLRIDCVPFSAKYPILKDIDKSIHEWYEWELLDRTVENEIVWDVVCSFAYSGDGDEYRDFSFPLTFVTNPEEFDAWEKEFRSKYKESLIVVVDKERKRKETLYNKLGKELGKL
jgi:hypothetical protein